MKKKKPTNSAAYLAHQTSVQNSKRPGLITIPTRPLSSPRVTKPSPFPCVKVLIQQHLLPPNISPPSRPPFLHSPTMADRAQQHRQTTGQITDSIKSILPDRGPTKSQALTVATLFPAGGLLLTLFGLTLAATVIGFDLLTLIFLLFSPALVPAALLMGLAVAGFITSGVLGLGGLSSLACFARAAKDMVAKAPDTIELSKRKMAEAAATVGPKAKETAQATQSKAQEAAGKTDK